MELLKFSTIRSQLAINGEQDAEFAPVNQSDVWKAGLHNRLVTATIVWLSLAAVLLTLGS